jgi:hypothetical protein
MGEAGLGLGTIDQLAPSQCSTNVAGRSLERRVAERPTATQLEVLAHATPFSELNVAPPGLGLGTIDQLVPSQCSTNVVAGVLTLACELPTAKQLVVLGHATPFRRLIAAPAGLGLGTIDQLVPFHRSTNVVVAPLASELPTAKQLVGLVHATSESVDPVVAATGAGTGTTTQLAPFQRWPIKCLGEVDLPTATQLVLLAHATAARLPF